MSKRQSRSISGLNSGRRASSVNAHKASAERRVKARDKKQVTSIVNVQAYGKRVWESLDTPVSLSCYLLALNGEWEQLVRKDVDPTHYLDAFDFWLDYQSVKLMSKCPGLPTGIATDTVAYRKFIECELSCKETNARFRDDEILAKPGLSARILESAERKISLILGPVPSLDALDFRFGPGAAFGVRGDTSSYAKLHSQLECTRTMLPLISEFLGEFPGWFPGCEASVTIVQGSELTLVPKDAKTDRPICIEPLLNGLGQKGIGAYMKRRLLRWGVDLRDQTINQRLASKAENLKLATVDFSSASDTIAYNLVWRLLPCEWSQFLDAFRCPRYLVDKTWYNFQKFSSMGNAYTFELETLIFFSLAIATCEELGITPMVGRNLHVYGDDVILPQEAFDVYHDVCKLCGFTVNQAKSFACGNFFESCGTDYLYGHLVTPFRQKNQLENPEEVYLAANNTIRMAERLYDLAGANPQGCATSNQNFSSDVLRRCTALASVHRWVVDHLRSEWRVYGPAAQRAKGDPFVGVITDESLLGDTHLWAPWDFACPKVGIFGYRYRAVVPEPTRLIPLPWLADWDAYERKEYASAAYALYKAQGIQSPRHGWKTDDLPWMGDATGYTVRGEVQRRRIRVWASEWSFPWCCWGVFYTQ